MLGDQVEIFAEIGEQPQVDIGVGREFEVAGRAFDGRPAAPIALQPRTKAIVVIACFELQLVSRPAAGRADRFAVQIIQLRNPVSDGHFIDEVQLVRDREGKPAALPAAKPAAAETTETASSGTSPVARRLGRLSFRLSGPRTLLLLASEPLAEGGNRSL